MGEKIKAFWHQHKSWMAFVLAAVGLLVYAVQASQLATYLTSLSLDEGMYMVKGYFFVTGKYAPYADYGPLTNHMPLSFIIPGAVQVLFGPSMAAGRYFAVFLGVVMVGGVWLAFYRLRGRWWAALGVWIFALFPTWIEVFSQGLSQGIVAALVVWAFVLLIGEERKYWQLILAAALTALAVMTRINVLPILGLMVAYIFWQHGWKKGGAAAGAALVVGIIVLAIFWPGVLKFISGWVPEGWLGFVEPYRSPWSQQHVPEGFGYFPLGVWFGDGESIQWSGIKALWEAFNVNFIPFLLVFGTLVFWPKKMDWPSKHNKRLTIFLVTAWLVMMAMHMWVALSGRSCRFYCLAGYFSFFNYLALLLIPAALPHWRWDVPVWRKILGFVVLVLTGGGAAFSAGYRPQMLSRRWYRFMDTPVPRFSDGRIITTDTGPLRSIFESKLGVSYHALVEVLPTYLYWIIIALFFFGLIPLIYRMFKRRVWKKHTQTLVSFSFLLLLTLGIALGPTPVFYGETNNIRCEESVIASHAEVGEVLANLIPAGSQVYWDLQSNILLLYLPDVALFAPQLNTGFNFVQVSDAAESDRIYRFSYWDGHLAEEWAKEADYLLVSGDHINQWQPEIDAGKYVTVKVTAPFEACRGDKARVILLAPGDED